jgi:hypothetical protein
MAFDYHSYKLTRVYVNTAITSATILQACKTKQMRPVCNHDKYADGECRLVGGWWYFLYPPHDKKHHVPVSKVSGVYFYTGQEHNGFALLNTGTTHKWRKQEPEGYTMCAKPLAASKTSFTFRGVQFVRTAVKGRMNAAGIRKACSQNGNMRPVCNYNRYQDGKCVAVGSKWHLSSRAFGKTKGLKPALIKGVFTYGGIKGGALLDQDGHNKHRWGKKSDRNGDTFCTKYRATGSTAVYNGYKIKRVRVSGQMNSRNIITACKQHKMKPVCDYKK